MRGGQLRYGLPAETNSFNPTVAQWGAYSMQVARALFDTLFLYDAEGNVRPNMVEKLEHNADYTQWTTTLRPGIRFTNGKEVTADTILKSQDYYRKSPVLGGVYALAYIDHSEVIDKLTYRTFTTRPWPTMPHQAMNQLAVVADPDWLASTAPDAWAHPIGTGPFKVQEWNLGKNMVLSRNPDYWQKDRWGTRLPYLDRLEFQIVPDDQQRAEMLESGKLDVMMQTLVTPRLAEMRVRCKAGALQCFSDEKGETPEDFVVMDTAKAPFNDIDARRAAAMAIDRDDYVQKITGGFAEPADGIFGPESPWYSPSTAPHFDAAEARRLVSVVKARNKGVFRFELLTNNTDEASRAAQYLQAAWKAVGIDASITSLDNQKKIIKMVTGEYQAALSQHFDFNHPAPVMAFLDPGQTKPGQLTLVFSRLNDAELGNRIEGVLRAQPSQAAWKTATGRVMDRLNSLVPFIWLDHAPRNVLARPTVVNVVQSTLPTGETAQDFLLGSHSVAQIWIKR